ncbi:MAG: hypothetical protein ACJ8M4_10830 [Chthoniobacterales bacterium]
MPLDIVFHSEPRLMVYRPRGTLSEYRINSLIEFLEKEEDAAEKPFNRFTDLSQVAALDLDVNAMIRISLYRRLAYGNYPPIKSAFYVTSDGAADLLKVHVLLTNHSPLKVKMFDKLEFAANWLEVSPEILESDSAV